MKNTFSKKCSHCLVGNQSNVTFKSSSPSRMSSTFNLVYFDVFSPMKTKKTWWCSLLCYFHRDHSRKLWICMLKTKNQVLDMFK